MKFDQLRKEVNAYCSGNGYSLNEREVFRLMRTSKIGVFLCGFTPTASGACSASYPGLSFIRGFELYRLLFQNNALLLIRLAENETAMEAACREAEVLRKEVARKQTQLNDQLILIKVGLVSPVPLT